MLIVHLLVDVRDAMGANTVNTMAEYIAPQVEKISQGQARLRILSNLADKRLVTASVKIGLANLILPSTKAKRSLKEFWRLHPLQWWIHIGQRPIIKEL
jgi:hydroxymethylglutaryl-CoA reductase